MHGLRVICSRMESNFSSLHYIADATTGSEGNDVYKHIVVGQSQSAAAGLKLSEQSNGFTLDCKITA